MGFPAKRDGWVVQLIPGGGDPGTNLAPSYGKKEWRRNWEPTPGFYAPAHARGVLHALPRRHKPRSRKYRKHMTRVPCAPYNTSSYLMRAGKLGIHAPLLSPATPALATPVISPATWPQESLRDGQVANDLGVNAYGSMNGRIRLRADDAERDSGSSSCGESDTDQCGRPPADSVEQVEERIDHGLQRFEILFTADSPVGQQETHIAQLEEENLSLQQRLWAMTQELVRLRQRLANDGGPEIVSDESLGDGSCAA